jgi:hypothetical protein
MVDPRELARRHGEESEQEWVDRTNREMAAKKQLHSLPTDERERREKLVYASLRARIPLTVLRAYEEAENAVEAARSALTVAEASLTLAENRKQFDERDANTRYARQQLERAETTYYNLRERYRSEWDRAQREELASISERRERASAEYAKAVERVQSELLLLERTNRETLAELNRTDIIVQKLSVDSVLPQPSIAPIVTDAAYIEAARAASKRFAESFVTNSLKP